MALKIAIISDLHCKFSKEPRASLTRLHSDLLREPWIRHPVEALLRKIKEDNIKADILLCPGDITDTVCAQGFISGWQYIEEVARALGVTDKIYATLGNHDVKFKEEKPEDAFKIAKNLKENYPLPSERHRDEFWANGFSFIEEDEYRLLIFNSVHDHFNTEASKKISIDIALISKIEHKLNKSNKKKLGIALSHHHPINHHSKDYDDKDFIDKGDELLRILNEANFSIYVHGHKHHPKLRYANKVAVFCSASFSSLENLIATESENMFHLFDVSDNKGKLYSWEYGACTGWKLNYTPNSFPCRTGFGFNGDVEQLAEEIDVWLRNQKSQLKSLKQLASVKEEIEYLIPEYQKQLEDLLVSEYNIKITPNIAYGSQANINIMEI